MVARKQGRAGPWFVAASLMGGVVLTGCTATDGSAASSAAADERTISVGTTWQVAQERLANAGAVAESPELARSASAAAERRLAYTLRDGRLVLLDGDADRVTAIEVWTNPSAPVSERTIEQVQSLSLR